MPLRDYPFDLAEPLQDGGVIAMPGNRIAPGIDLTAAQDAGIGMTAPAAPMAFVPPPAPDSAPMAAPVSRGTRPPMGDDSRIAYALEAFGAGMRGQPSLAEREAVDRRKEKSQRLLEIKAEVDVYESAVKAVKGASGPQRKTITDDLASQFDADRPGLAKSIRGLATKDDGQLAVVSKYAKNSPTLKRALETGGLEAALKLIDSPTVTAELDVSAMPNIVRKANGLRLGFKDILPPEMVKRFGDALDGSEYIEAVDWMKANLPESSPFRKLIPDEAETLIAQRNSKAFHTQAGMMSPEDQAAVAVDAAKQENRPEKKESMSAVAQINADVKAGRMTLAEGEAAKKKALHISEGVKVNVGAPIAGVDTDPNSATFGKPIFVQPSKKGGAATVVPGVAPIQKKSNLQTILDSAGGKAAPSKAAAKDTPATLPPAIASALKAGVNTTLSDGSVWTLEGGKPKKVR